MKKCSMSDCNKPVACKALCNAHYLKLRRHGSPHFQGSYKTPQESFKARTESSNGCLLWTGSINKSGYGAIRVNGETRGAHRFAWTESGRSIPSGRTLDHTCHVRRCVNVDHLRLATPKQQAENLSGPTMAGSSGHRGVSPHGRKWRARVRHGGKLINAGTYDRPEEAAEAARQLRLSLFTHNIRDRS